MSGNAPSKTAAYIGTYTAMGYYMDAVAVSANTMQLNKLKWETSKEIDLGTDINLWDGKLTASFDYYQKKTKDLLQTSVTIPESTGYPTNKLAYYNSGRLKNEGWEFRVDYEVFKNKTWQFKVNWNVNRNINTIVELPENQSTEEYTFNNGEYAKRIIAGTAVGSFFGYKYKGVYQNTKDTYGKDAEGNIMYDLQGKPIVMTNGFVKKQQKTPKAQIALAKKYRKIFLERNNEQ